jgi:hypothetical protein
MVFKTLLFSNFLYMSKRIFVTVSAIFVKIYWKNKICAVKIIDIININRILVVIFMVWEKSLCYLSLSMYVISDILVEFQVCFYLRKTSLILHCLKRTSRDYDVYHHSQYKICQVVNTLSVYILNGRISWFVFLPFILHVFDHDFRKKSQGKNYQKTESMLI